LIRWTGHLAWTEGIRNAYKILVGKPEGKTTWETNTYTGRNIKKDLKEIGREGVDWIPLAQDKIP
jgi:hypothetical protein